MDTNSSSIKSFAFRLKPKADLKKSIIEFAKENGILAGAIVTCVGSLEQVNIRYANQKASETRKGYFEIVSLCGTFSDSSCHLHISVSDEKGQTVGGHLMDDSLIYTTAELVVVDLTDIEFEREADNTYGFQELIIKQRTR
jgi:predicted DNA-binding protein with PD1-like motif